MLGGKSIDVLVSTIMLPSKLARPEGTSYNSDRDK